MTAPNKKCEGNCECHKGSTQLVRVWDKKKGNNKDWGHFWYCQEAIEIDEKNGLTVYIVNDMPGIY